MSYLVSVLGMRGKAVSYPVSQNQLIQRENVCSRCAPQHCNEGKITVKHLTIKQDGLTAKNPTMAEDQMRQNPTVPLQKENFSHTTDAQMDLVAAVFKCVTESFVLSRKSQRCFMDECSLISVLCHSDGASRFSHHADDARCSDYSRQPHKHAST